MINLYHFNLYSQYRNARYAKITLRNICKEKSVQDVYYHSDEFEKRIPNPKMVGFGSMKLSLLIPDGVSTEEELNFYIADHSKFITEMLVNLDLYGIIKVNKTIYAEKYLDDDKNPIIDGVVNFKYIPKYGKFYFTLSMYCVAIFSLLTLLKYVFYW